MLGEARNNDAGMDDDDIDDPSNLEELLDNVGK